MLKRKRPASDNGDAQPKERNITMRAARLEQKIEHGVVLLHRALKTARGFERQKLGRRQKTARVDRDRDALERLDAEVAALKALDLHVAAERYLVKQLVKTKRIAESSTFAQLDESKRTLPQDGPKDGPAANVTARMFNSNPVRGALPGVMDDIKRIIGLPEDKKDATGKKAKKDKKAVAEAVSGSEDEVDARVASDSDVSMGEDVDDKHYASRLAPSGSDSEDEDDDGAPQRTAYELSRDISLSPTPSDSGSDSLLATAQKTSKSKSKSKPENQSAASDFLPSLMGGYWSGSESEPEDDDVAAAGNVRRNRMGQQARRKLWEKKFGSGANHVKTQISAPNRDSGWDMRRGATDGQDARGAGRFGRGGRGGSGFGNNPRERFQGSGDRPSRPARDDRLARPAAGGRFSKPAADNKPIHPSWEAAKKAKEKKTNVAFEGKKVTFD